MQAGSYSQGRAPLGPQPSASATAERSALDQLRLFGTTLVPLPASAEEARSVARSLEAAGLEVRSLVGERASLPALEESLRGARIVHLATHGFFASFVPGKHTL
mgnify:CR=1 FL=1